MAEWKPWLKMWVEWIHDPKMLGLTLAETGAWWKLITLAQQCAAEGQLVKGNGSPLSLPEIANSLHISTPKDMKTLQSMIQKMESANSLSWNNKTLTIIHFAERQELTPSSSREAVRERVRRHRERQRHLPIEALGEEVRSLLLTLPEPSHEEIKEALIKLGQAKRLVPRPEVITDIGRIDLLWQDLNGEKIAAFEIDMNEPKAKSLRKLRGLCPSTFIILRTNPQPLLWEGDILLIGLSKESSKKTSPLPEDIEKDIEAEVEVESNTVTPVTPEAILAEIVKKYEENFGIISPILSEKFKDFAENYRGPIEWIHDAFEEAVTNNVRKWAYVEAILDRWQQEGREKHGERKQRKGARDAAHQRGTKEPSAERYRQSLER